MPVSCLWIQPWFVLVQDFPKRVILIHSCHDSQGNSMLCALDRSCISSQAMTCHTEESLPFSYRLAPWQAVYVIHQDSWCHSTAYECTGHQSRSRAVTYREMHCRGAYPPVAHCPHGRQYMSYTMAVVVTTQRICGSLCSPLLTLYSF